MMQGMCHDDDSRPPAPPISGEVAARVDLTLTAADGNRVLAHSARPAAPTGIGVVVMPDVRGLHEYYRELAARFAEAGIDAVAIDYFGRTAPTDDRSEAFEYRPHVDQTTDEGVAADVAAGVALLRSDGGGVERVFTVGFCFGGGRSWAQSADTPGLGGCIGFYGRPAMVERKIDGMSAPLLILAAGADQATSPEESEQFAARVRAGGGTAELHMYDGAPHSFFDRSFAEHRDACADAWQRILTFVGHPAA